MGNNKTKATKARRESIAEKLKNVASTVAKQQQQQPPPPPPPVAGATSASVSVQQDDDDSSGSDVLARAEARAARQQSAFLTPAEMRKAQQDKARELQRAAAAATSVPKNNFDQDDDTPTFGHFSSTRVAAASAAPNKKIDSSKLSDDAVNALSKKQRKLAARPNVQQLKAAARRPDLVELHDANAPEPGFLLELKQMRNTVPVPDHWAQKSSFLSRTVDRDSKSAFEATVTPPWVEHMDIGAAWKSKGAGGVHPRKLILPFVVGHAEPELTGFGDIFAEGKDMRARVHGFQPGVLSERMRSALEIGSASHNIPPPWLTGMQAVGRLPPAYPNHKVPGVNAPIPSGARYGKGRHEWGEPPRDPNNPNNFLFEGVMRSSAAQAEAAERRAEQARWGGGGGPEVGAIDVFTMPKAEWEEMELGRRRREEEEEEARQRHMQEDAMRAAQHYQKQQAAAAAAAAAQQANTGRGNNTVQVPAHVLQRAGVIRGPNQQQQQQQGQFAVEVNTQQQQGGLQNILRK